MEQTADIEGSPVVIETDAGQLAGRFYAPHGEVRAHLVVHAATGVRQRYYGAFARWAAERGVGVLTYDYRDFGDSLQTSMRDSDATMADWGLRDAAAAERKLAELAPEGPLWALGHSLGGLTIAFRAFDPRFEQFITIGSGQVHHSDHPMSYKPMALLFWFVIGPPLTMLAGYVPGRKTALGADLPAGVFWQWRRWCTTRGFFEGDIGRSLPEPKYHAEGPPLRICAMTDDVMVPPAAVWRHADSFPAERVTRRVLKPEQFGLPSLRHIEIFSKRNSAAWSELLGLTDPA